MLNTVITTIKKYLGISNYVREETKRPLEQESENECEEDIFHYTQPQKKKKCSDGDHHLTSSNDAPDLSPVLMRFPWFTERKEENKSSDVKMSSRKSQQQKEGCDAEVTIVEERVKKWSSPFPCSTSVLVSGTAEPENDFEALEKREARNVGEQTSCCHHPTQSSFADLHFAPSISESVQSDFHAKQKSRNFDCSSRSRNHKSRMKKSGFKGPLTTVLDRPLGRKKSLSFLSSRIKWSLVHKSFLHEEKRKYRQLLQQYTDHYLIPNSKVLSHKVSRSSLFTSSNPGAGMLHTASNASFTRSDATATAASYSVPSSPVGMVTRSHWTPFLTKKKQEQIESITGSSTPRLLPSTDSTTFEEVMGSRKVISLDENVGKYKKQEKSSSIYVPLVDLSKDDNEEQSTSDRESDGDSVIMIKEMLSPQAQRNSLEDRLKEHPLYDLEWVKTMRKEYEDRAYIAQKNADTTSELIQELQQRRNKKSSLQEKVTQGLKLLDLTYPSKYTEVQLPDEEEEVLVPLTPEMENEIDDALNRTPQSEVLIEKFHIQITRRDIKTLNGLNWLNDEVINFYMNLLMERSEKKDKYPRVYAFNTFFYSKLSKSGYHSVRRWTKKVDLFSYDMLLVPIHLGMHWCMAVVDFKTKCISYYDSMLHSNEWCLESLLEYLKAEHQDKKGSSYDTDIWKLQNKKNIPQQMNGSDCGMFACKFADYLSRRAKINFDQEHMPYFRRRMVYEIINAKLL